MAEIRLNKIVRQFNIGLSDLVKFIREQGVEVDENPNSKVSEDLMPLVAKAFGKDLEAKQAAEKVNVKLSEIVEKSSHKKKSDDSHSEEDEGEPVVTIKSNTFFNEKKDSKTQIEEQPEVPETEVEPVAEESKETIEHEEPAKPVAVAADPEPAVEPEPVKAELEHVVEQPEVEEKVAEPEPVVAPAPVENPVEEVKVEKPVVEPEKVEAPKAPEKKVVEDTAVKPQKKEHVQEKHTSKQPIQSTAPAKTETPGFKVVGKIDLSQFDKKKSSGKRERISKQKVDLAKAGATATNSSKRNGQNPSGNNNQGGKNNKKDKGARFRPAPSAAEQERMQQEIQKQVKETYAKMNEGKKNNFGAKYRKEKREAASARAQEEFQQQVAENSILKVTEFLTANDLANLMNVPVLKVIGACMSLGLMVSINQRLDAETIVLVAEEFGFKVDFVTAGISEDLESQEPDKEEDLESRPPIVTVMGHVDHGKTSLLDYIRKANVIAGEAGGITQHIGAYNVTLDNGRRITFLDTPGHEAFTAMRARGAQMTDLAIIIIAADDAVMPQTIEAINHAQAAGVPMVFAINKIDKPGANPDTIRRQLSEMNILVEDWGGKYQCQEISAKSGLGVSDLLDKVLLETDLLDLKANPNRLAQGAVIESSLDKGRGYLATVLVQNGTLHRGDCILCGSYFGRVRNMFNERGQKIDVAGPSTPVSILGLNGAPAAGEKFNVMADEKEAKSIATKREQLIRIQGIKTQKHMTLEEIGRRIAIGNFKELNVIVKGDVDGSVEALSDSLIKLSTEQVKVNVIHKAVGGISESDVLLAQASDAVIVGFQVRPTTEARKAADAEGIEIRLYSIIYDCINEIKDGIEGMLEPEKKEEVAATAEVKQTFRISKIGTIAGCIVRDGKMTQKAKVRLIRDGIVVYTGELSSLQVGKDPVKEVSAGKECGMGIAGYNDIKNGDVIEAYRIVEIKRTL